MKEANGVAQGVAETPQGATMLPGRLTKSRADKQPILSLVDREYLKSTANIPRSMWEPMSYLYSEADKSLERLGAMVFPDTPEKVKVAAQEWLEANPLPTVPVKQDHITPAQLVWWRRAIGQKPKPLAVATRKTADSKERLEAAIGYFSSLAKEKEAAVKKWHQVIGWLDELLVQSGSVDALRSWQLMSGMQAQNGQQARPSAAIMPDFPQPQPPGQSKERRKRGLQFP